jgi:hypothetical protein
MKLNLPANGIKNNIQSLAVPLQAGFTVITDVKIRALRSFKLSGTTPLNDPAALPATLES